MMLRAVPLACALAALLSCATAPPESDPAVPDRLPSHVRPLRYGLELEIVPERERFRGQATIWLALDRPVETLFLHGRDLEVEGIELFIGGLNEALQPRWEPVGDDGLAALRLAEPVGPGPVWLHLRFSAPFGRTLRGLYRVDVGDDAYAFTQFEPIAARRAFPAFDEPGWKTPFDVTLVVPEGHVAIASTPVLSEEPAEGGLRRVRFATTPPLPTYLIAFAVGPLDVVEAAPMAAAGPRNRPLPLRGVAARGRGAELAYALQHTPPLLTDLERYFDLAYPYAKLDLIAVPDFGAGAMENVGAITVREALLLLGADAPEWQRRAFTYLMAHELAHQWFGNLVTPAWWDDLWLNEAFASWLGSRTVARVAPEQRADLGLLAHVHGAMDADSLESARRIRQPIESSHDIRNAFDAITYSKGAGVLAMFERWLGEERFRDGVRRYVARHREGSARSEDLLAALSATAGRDVATPFATFLTQPGVPFVEVETHCRGGAATLSLRQSRFLPLGSRARRGALWQVPVCARYAVDGRLHESCTLLDAREGELPLEGCPDWVLPNAAAAGYYRFSQPAEETRRLLAARDSLEPRERLALVDALGAALATGAWPAARLFEVLPDLAGDPERRMATAPMDLLRLARDHFADDATRGAVERFARALYGPHRERLGWEAAPGEDGEARLRREQVIGFLARVARDPEVRSEAARRGRAYAGLEGPADPGALAPELVETALGVAVQEGGAPVFDALQAQLFASEDALVRGRRLSALAASDDPALAARARELALDPRLRVNEVFSPLGHLMGRRETRSATWDWIESNFDAIVARVGPERGSALPSLAGSFCTRARARSVGAFFAPRVDALVGGPRNLAAALEQIRLCAALVQAQGASARAFFAGRSPRATVESRPYQDTK